jgi:hypothetical protein
MPRTEHIYFLNDLNLGILPSSVKGLVPRSRNRLGYHAAFFRIRSQVNKDSYDLFYDRRLKYDFIRYLQLRSETPARRLVNGVVDLCIAPSESVVSCWTSDDVGKDRPVAVAAVLQNDTSAVFALKSSGIVSAAQLDGRKYASYQGLEEF